MDFKYSKQQDVDELVSHLAELQLPNAKGLRSLRDIKSGYFDNTQKITAVEIAIQEHHEAKTKEKKAYDDAIVAAESLAIKKAAYPMAVKYVKALEDALTFAQSIKGGHGFIPSDYFLLADGRKAGEIAVVLSEARKGLNYLNQFKD